MSLKCNLSQHWPVKLIKRKQMENSAENKPSKLPIVISDLIGLIHMVIIKEQGENEIVLKELSSIDEKIQSGQLVNYDVTDHPFWKTWENKRNIGRTYTEDEMQLAFDAGRESKSQESESNIEKGLIGQDGFYFHDWLVKHIIN